MTPGNGSPLRSTTPPSRGAKTVGAGRKNFDAACMLAFGVLLLFASGHADSPVLPVLLGLAAIVYAGYIAFFATRYYMATYVYVILVLVGVCAVAWAANGA